MRSGPTSGHGRVDHILVSVRGLDEAIDRWGQAGLVAVPGGTHPTGTTNALVRGQRHAYLELIDASDESTHATALSVRSRVGPLSWAVNVDDLETSRDRLKQFGLVTSEPVAGSRVAPTGEAYAWQFCEVTEDALHPFIPFLIQWEVGMSTGPADGPDIVSMTLEVPEPSWLAELLVCCGLDQPHRSDDSIVLSDGEVEISLHHGSCGIVSVGWSPGSLDAPVVLDGLICTIHTP
ncbi:VOC family protein [Aeromicrobium sp. UC242_57]|uniref:VOC family protein n=1 Tax=Aeromicrobium sp. UC242_57 TaxID=3374624 RepID=UPI0037B00011